MPQDAAARKRKQREIALAANKCKECRENAPTNGSQWCDLCRAMNTQEQLIRRLKERNAG